MENKSGKSKVVKCEFKKENTFKPKGTDIEVTLYKFLVEFEDGTRGVYQAKDKDSPKFVVGKECPYEATVADYKDENGEKHEYYEIRYHYEKKGTKGGLQFPQRKTKEESLVENASFCLSYAERACEMGKLDLGKVLSQAQEWYAWIEEIINKNYE